jgi:hypothetical protein
MFPFSFFFERHSYTNHCEGFMSNFLNRQNILIKKMFSWVFQAHLGLQEPDPRVLRLTSSTGVAPWSLRGSIELLTEPQYESSPMETRMIKQSRLALESWRHNETLQLWNPIESCGLILGGLLRSNGESQGSHHSSPSKYQLIQERWGFSLVYWWFTLELWRLT